mmetsp:Transcript_65305/g.154238  ORF Transcript_65305/g.154238 Transcript_65305/m.154238 type:complete len:214 (+) Transcript_65305:819-1460(+)
MPAAGQPWAVSSTCVVSFPMASPVLDAQCRDAHPPLPPRPDRLRREPTSRSVARQRPRGGAVRAELRRGRRELGAAWRCRQRAVPLRDVQPGQLPGPAPEHGEHLRVRFARRRVADAEGVRAARAAADGVRRGHGAGARARRDPGLCRAEPRDRLARLALDPLPGRRRRHRTRPPGPGHGQPAAPHPRPPCRRTARPGLVHRPRQPQHAPPGG